MSSSQRATVPARMPVDTNSEEYEIYNIIPVQNMLADHPALRFPEVRGAAAALKTVGELRKPPFVRWNPSWDLLDWLGLFFGFQKDNVKNQREHLILLLANSQMRLQPPPGELDKLEPIVVRKLRKKILKNYESWCAFLARKSNVWISERRRSEADARRELLYISLYLLIWGEAANLRFLPECLCYIFHNMAMELNKILEDYMDERTGQPSLPEHRGENAFLMKIVTPIYETVKAEAEASLGGKSPHSAWRNYDDINEYFWSNRCFKHLGWPIKGDSNFFVPPEARKETGLQRIKGMLHKQKVGKTGFVEQRTFWNIFHSFDRLWIMYVLFLQAAILVSWDGNGVPWDVLKDKDNQVKLLSLFITWAGLRFWQSLLDAGMQFSLISRETPLQGIRMVLKTVTAAVWTILFTVLYVRMWNERNYYFRWTREADRRLNNFLWAAVIFVAPEILALALFIVPWFRNFLEKTNWRIFHLLTWWFQSRIYVGRGIREGLFSNILYSLFWILLLAVKFSFSYQFQIKPMVSPTKSILKVHDIKYRWHEFFKNNNRFAIGALWAPVILIYFMDTQIWYSILSSMVGALVGLFNHLGEIRNVQQLRLRFQFFASAIQFNLMSEEPLFRPSGSVFAKIKDAWKRFTLRYGFGTPYKKIESNQAEAGRFALIWNEIIRTFREEDILSNLEVELLEMPLNSWNIRVIQWPCLLLCNELLLALSQAKTLECRNRRLWRKISKYEYRRCAVIETYDSVKHLLLRIVSEDSEEYLVIKALFEDIERAIALEQFTEKYKTRVLPEIHSKLIALVGAINQKPSARDLQKVVNALQNLYEIVIRDFPTEKRDIEELRRDGLVSQSGSGKLLFGDAVQLPDADDEAFYKQLRRLLTILTARDSMNNVPRNLEARRRIAFFSNSLFMNMPHAPQVEKMMAFSVLTPYYDEDVIYSKEQLRTMNEDGVSIIFYLQKIFNDEWTNFLERMAQKGIKDESELWGNHIRELRLWASYRGQTLSRTVRGMMYYHKALKLLAFLDTASEMDIRNGFKELVATASRQRAEAVDLSSSSFRSGHSVGSASGRDGVIFKDYQKADAMLKFTYVVACQIYGTQKSKRDPRADDILYLMKNNEALRVAYVDSRRVGRDSSGRDVWEYFSVLVKYDPVLQREVEIYRVKLPGPLKLGEGKPENQNHAIIFTRGDAIQTIDMNQDNYFEEALKMRNLLQEFIHYYGIRKPTILGVREHVFTGSVSSLAWFMSAQETSFVTLGQRVLATPLKVRMHYGHPDVFDRLWFLNRGGLSKASRVINISEDIFAGFNCTLRQGNITHHEYIQVGKGRDVGLNQISMFEAKVASGNGEQVLSRDICRLGHRLDFFRMLSVYYTTIGFYFNSMMIILTVYTFLWGRVYLTLSGLEAVIQGVASSTGNKALGAILNQQFIVQLGLFTALPMIIENSLEQGFLTAIWDFLTMQLQLASVFYTFSMGTRTHYFGRTILHGGAKYRATGRGFVVQHKKFAENYRLYARSHFVKAVELGVLLIIYASYSVASKNTLVYIMLTISSWFLVFSWIMAPFLFNPSGFDWLKTVYDYEDFMNWIWYRGGILTKSEQSWEVWWNEENDHLRSSGLWALIVEILLDLRFFFFQYGIVYQLGIANKSTSILVYLLSWTYIVFALAVYVSVSYAHEKYAAKQHIYYRAIQALVISIVILAMVLLFQFAHLRVTDLLTSLLAFIPTGWGLISIAQVLKPFLQHSTVVWNTVMSVARLYEIMFGMIVMLPMAILSWLPGFQAMQTRILFNEAFSRGLQISRILAGKKTN